MPEIHEAVQVPSSKLAEEQSKKRKKTHVPSMVPTTHSHHPTLTPTATPTIKLHHSSHQPTHSKTTEMVEGGKSKPNRVGDDPVIEPSPEPTTSIIQDEPVEPSPEPQVSTTKKSNLRGGIVKDDVSEPSPDPSINSINGLKDDVPEPTIAPSTNVIQDEPVVEPTVIPSTSTLKDDVPEPTVIPSTSGMKDDIPEPTVVPSVSWSFGEDPVNFNFTVQPTIAPANDFTILIGDEPIPYPPPVNSSIMHTQSLIEQTSDYSNVNSAYNSSPYSTYIIGSMFALLVSVGIAFYYRKRFQYKRIPSGTKIEIYGQEYA